MLKTVVVDDVGWVASLCFRKGLPPKARPQRLQLRPDMEEGPQTSCLIAKSDVLVKTVLARVSALLEGVSGWHDRGSLRLGHDC
jgi:hypothetical protein